MNKLSKVHFGYSKAAVIIASFRKAVFVRLLIVLLASLAFSPAFANIDKTQGQKQSGKRTHVAKTKHVAVKAKSRIRVKHTRRPVHNAIASPIGNKLQLHSAVVLIIDQIDGHIIYSKNMGSAVPIASITKLMTAMVTLDARLPLAEDIVITSDDVDRLRNSTSRIRVGVTLSRRQLLQLALMSSENRAAAALARTYPGGLPAFIVAMNQKAKQLGMEHTILVDGTGLNSQNVSTAEDLAKMVSAAHDYPLIRSMTTSSSYMLSNAKARKLEFRNTNMLVKNRNWNIGLSKTGYINEAGHCLVMQAQIANRPTIIVLLDSWGKQTRIGDANRIKKWIEANKNTVQVAG